MESKTIKLLILGDCSVGKTSLLLRYTGNYEEVFMPTVGLHFKSKKICVSNNCYDIHV